jgi:hypothetical protein
MTTEQKERLAYLEMILSYEGLHQTCLPWQVAAYGKEAESLRRVAVYEQSEQPPSGADPLPPAP